MHLGPFQRRVEVIGYKNHKMAEFKVPTMAEMLASGQSPEVLFWVGCAGSFDDRAKRITKAIAKILHHANVSFAVLGAEGVAQEIQQKELEMNPNASSQNIAVLNATELSES